MTYAITHNGNDYTLMLDHSMASYGQPVLVDSNGIAYGTDDAVSPDSIDIFGDPYQLTARLVVANWARSHMPDDYAQLDLRILRFAGLL